MGGLTFLLVLYSTNQGVLASDIVHQGAVRKFNLKKVVCGCRRRLVDYLQDMIANVKKCSMIGNKQNILDSCYIL